MLLACLLMASYGDNFRRLRGRVSQEEIARRLKLKRQANVSAIELGTNIPGIKTILRHAAALHHPPSELLKDVVTDYDRIRAGAYDAIQPASVSGQRTKSLTQSESAPQRDGSALAETSVAANAQPDSVPRASHSVDRGTLDDIDGHLRTLERRAARVARKRRADRKRAATPRAQKTARGGRAGNDRG